MNRYRVYTCTNILETVTTPETFTKFYTKMPIIPRPTPVLFFFGSKEWHLPFIAYFSDNKLLSTVTAQYKFTNRTPTCPF